MPIPPTPPELGPRLSPRTPTPSASVPRNPNVAFPFRGPHDRLRVRPAHHSEGFSMQELRLYVNEHLPSNEPPEVLNQGPLSPDLSPRSTPGPSSPSVSPSPSPSR
jgi:hypothetical protein